MKKLKNKIIQFAVAKAKQSKFLKSIIEKPIDLNKLPVTGSFTDNFGNSFTLYDNLRSKIKPNWQTYFSTVPTKFTFDDKTVNSIFENSLLQVNRIEPLINSFGDGIKGKTIAEIGCHSGGVCYAFARKGAEKIVGTDYVEYKVSSSDSKETDKAGEEVTSTLSELRNKVAERFEQVGKVKYLNDDICNSTLNDNTFDLVCSWDVLEHIHKPEGAFTNIYRILKPGGISIHEYNPFFGLNGGHSACTIDFPWGHVALDSNNFEKYCIDIQPQRKDKAMSFYKNGLNRMTINDLQKYISNAGLELVAFLPYTKESQVYLLNKQILEQSIMNYSSLTVTDLLSPRIVIVLKKPTKQ